MTLLGNHKKNGCSFYNYFNTMLHNVTWQSILLFSICCVFTWDIPAAAPSVSVFFHPAVDHMTLGMQKKPQNFAVLQNTPMSIGPKKPTSSKREKFL